MHEARYRKQRQRDREVMLRLVSDDSTLEANRCTSCGAGMRARWCFRRRVQLTRLARGGSGTHRFAGLMTQGHGRRTGE
jgi:hypothetical protein